MHPRIVLISLICASGAIAYAQGVPKPYAETLPKSVVKLEMVPVPAGTFKGAAMPAYFMAKTETVWELFDLFLKSGPPSKAYDQTVFPADAVARPSRSYILPDLGWGHNGYPVISVSFQNAEMFCRWLSSVTKKKYRLPTELEWEWACRSAADTPWKVAEPDLAKMAWYEKNSSEMTHPVGKKAANKIGLFDMMGNVGEWATTAKGDPILCGPTFLDAAKNCSPTRRQRWAPSWQETDPQIPKSRWWLSDGPFVGFRVVCVP